MAIFGISPQTAEHGRQLRERLIRDAQIDQAAHKNHEAFWQDPRSAFPLRLISDPENALGGKVGAVRDQHWAGPMVHPTTYLVDADGIVRWRFQSKMAQRRPSPILLANMAGALANKQPLPEYVED